MRTGAVRTQLVKGFDDPALGPEQWNRLLGDRDLVYMTWQCQRAWWETLGRGELLLITAERDGEVVALAPFFTEARMVYFLGSSFELDYLDFLGDISDPDVLDALLETARDCVPGLRGFVFYFVPDATGTGERLQAAARRLGLSCYCEDEMPAPALDLAGQSPELAEKKSLARYERRLRRQGEVEVRHLRDGEAILPQLDELVAQHTARWEGRGNPSRFLYPKSRAFFERLTCLAGRTDWLRFTRIDWEGRPIAFHYGLCFRGRFFWGTPAFALDVARYSPGQVLLRQLLLAAIREGVNTFDFGTGAAPFKLRFATKVALVRTWGLYPTSDPRPGTAAQVVPLAEGSGSAV